MLPLVFWGFFSNVYEHFLDPVIYPHVFVQLIISLPVHGFVSFFPLIFKWLRFVVLRSTSLQRWFSARVMESRSIGGPWGSSFMSSWWAACRSSETRPRSYLDRSSQVRGKNLHGQNWPTHKQTTKVISIFQIQPHYSPVLLGVHAGFPADHTF